MAGAFGDFRVFSDFRGSWTGRRRRGRVVWSSRSGNWHARAEAEEDDIEGRVWGHDMIL